MSGRVASLSFLRGRWVAAREHRAMRRGPAIVFGGVISLAAAIMLGPDTTFVMIPAVLLLIVARNASERALAVILIVGFRAALWAGLFDFQPPSQVLDLVIKNIDPWSLVAQNDIWWPRYLLSYPPVVAVDRWTLRFDRAYALYNTALLPMYAFALTRAARMTFAAGRRVPGTLLTGVGLGLVVCAIATQMNGRLIPAHFGMTLLLIAQMRAVLRGSIDIGAAVLMPIGLVFSHMTTGTGFIAYVQFLTGCALLAVTQRRDRSTTLGYAWLVTAAFAPLLYRDVTKNMDFYGGGLGAIPNMLNHGAGELLVRSRALAIAAVVLGGIGIAVAWRTRDWLLARPPVLYPLMLAIPLAGLGGLFGYSTMTMILPAIFVLAYHGTGVILERRTADYA